MVVLAMLYRGGNQHTVSTPTGTGVNGSKPTMSRAEKETKESDAQDNAKEVGIVTMDLKGDDLVLEKPSLPYIHCGPKYSTLEADEQTKETSEQRRRLAEPSSSDSPKELLLLHGARFTKDTWNETGILDKLCAANPTLSVTALDLTTSALAADYHVAIQALQNEGLLSGNPLFLVTPSASGKTVVSLVEAAHKNKKPLQSLLAGWIPVAANNVLDATDEVLLALKETPILAVYGNQDKMGNKSTKRLQTLLSATPVELNGTHPCYIDSPDDFVKVVSDFVTDPSSVDESD